jgi:putative ABC transport system permease protein
MVGVGFYAGIQITSPNIVSAADSYYKNFRLLDFKIVSSMGLTDDDVYALEQLDGVLGVIASYSLDVQSRGNVIRVHALEDNVNIVKLTEGRMPLSGVECVADSRKYGIGDVIEVTGDVDGKIENAVFTVVGLVDSVLYLHDDYGSTIIGNGHLSSFIFVNRDNFILETYTEIYVIIETYNAVAYSEEYVDSSAKLNDDIVGIKLDRENARFDEIFNEVKRIIEEKEAELNSEIEKAEKEFEEAKIALDENAQKLQYAKNELAEKEAQLEEIIKTQNAEFNVSKQQIANAWEEINSSLLVMGITADEVSVKIWCCLLIG